MLTGTTLIASTLTGTTLIDTTLDGTILDGTASVDAPAKARARDEPAEKPRKKLKKANKTAV